MSPLKERIVYHADLFLMFSVRLGLSYLDFYASERIPRGNIALEPTEVNGHAK